VKRRNPRWDIDVQALITALQDHVQGSKPMTHSQVNAALALLRKRMPDLVKHKPKKGEARPEGSLKDLE